MSPDAGSANINDEQSPIYDDDQIPIEKQSPSSEQDEKQSPIKGQRPSSGQDEKQEAKHVLRTSIDSVEGSAISDLESLCFSLDPIIPDSMVDYNEIIVRKDEPCKNIKIANMTLNQIEAYKEMLSQVPDVESTWLQSFDDSTARGYEDRKTANEIREAYMWDQGFGEPSAIKSEDYGGYAEREYKDMAKISRVGKMQYAIDDYNDRFYDTSDNFKSVRVPALWMKRLVYSEDTYEIAVSQYGGFKLK